VTDAWSAADKGRTEAEEDYDVISDGLVGHIFKTRLIGSPSGVARRACGPLP